jgi:hypothetical protein
VKKECLDLKDWDSKDSREIKEIEEILVSNSSTTYSHLSE